MVYRIKFVNKKYKNFDSLCTNALQSIKYYKNRIYPTLPKSLDSIMRDWVQTVECPIGEKIYYKKVSEGGTRKYYIEKNKDKKQVLKVSIQSNENQKSKKSGTFEVLSCEQEFYRILNDFLKNLQSTGHALEAASYYRQLSTTYDIGRDRLSYVLKWLSENLQVDHEYNETNESNALANQQKNSNFDLHLDESVDISSEPNTYQFNSDEYEDDELEDDESKHSDDNGNETFGEGMYIPKSNSSNSIKNIFIDIQKENLIETKCIRKRDVSRSLTSCSSKKSKTLNETISSLTIWDNKAGVYKTVSPIKRDERRCARNVR